MKAVIRSFLFSQVCFPSNDQAKQDHFPWTDCNLLSITSSDFLSPSFCHYNVFLFYIFLHSLSPSLTFQLSFLSVFFFLFFSIFLSTYLPNFFPTFSFRNLFTIEETIAWGVSTNDTILKIWFRNFFNKFYFWKLLYCFLWQIFISRPIICSLSSTYE